MIEFKLPSLGADIDEGTLLEWLVKPGDRVSRGQIVAVVDTSKAAVEIESWQEGIVHALVAQPEQVLPVGAVMALLRAEGEAAPADGAATVAAAPIPAQAPLPGAAPIAGSTPATTAAPGSAPIAAAGAVDRRKVSPAARKHAAELGVDLDAIMTASGPHGSVTVEDVERAARRPIEPRPAVPAAAEAASVRPTAGAAAQTTARATEQATDRAAERATQMRRTIAAAMTRAKRDIPHYYLAEPIPLRAAAQWLAQQNARRPMAERLLMAAVLLKAVARTLAEFSDLNGLYRDGAYAPAAAVHLGVAISLRQGGLIAPALHDVGSLSLDQLMQALGDLVQRARAGSLRSSELSDATVTVTNLGDQGVEAVQGIIYPPQVALVGFGRIAERPWAIDGAIAVLPVVTASLAADHRVSDGHRGARFLAALRDRLQQPETL